jgi:hypothetical protein
MNSYKEENEKRTSMTNYMLNYEEEDKYIDKGSLTSRECGRLVKGMVESYERKYKY